MSDASHPLRSLTEPSYLGVDGGGTKTVAVVLDATGTVRGRATAGPSGYKTVGLASALATLQTVAAQAVAAAGHPPIARAVFGLSDLDVPADCERLAHPLQAALRSAGLTIARCDLCNDAVIALASGGALDQGIVVVAGTGSVAFGLAGGREARAGGWGPPFGDEGSAYWLGAQAISQALRLADAGQPTHPLVQTVTRALGFATLTDLVAEPVEAWTRDRVAALAPALADLARTGEPIARTIFRTAARELARLATTLAARLDLTGTAFDLVLVGGVWQTPLPEFHQTFRRAVRHRAPGARLVFPPVEPAVGAARLARFLDQSGRPCPSGLIRLPGG